MGQVSLQVLLNQFSKLFRLQNLAFGAEAEYPAFDFVEAGYSEGYLQLPLRELGHLLALMPDLLPSKSPASRVPESMVQRKYSGPGPKLKTGQKSRLLGLKSLRNFEPPFMHFRHIRGNPWRSHL